jgi:hypothetical protein
MKNKANRRARRIVALAIAVGFASLAGCELAVDFDRQKIDAGTIDGSFSEGGTVDATPQTDSGQDTGPGTDAGQDAGSDASDADIQDADDSG